jgi:hypothetical protein
VAVQDGDTRCSDYPGVSWPEGGSSCWAGFAYFSYLMLNVEELVLSGTPVYPAERCLLATGIVDAAFDSKDTLSLTAAGVTDTGAAAGAGGDGGGGEGRVIATPWLAGVSYSLEGREVDRRKWTARGARPRAECLELWADGPRYEELCPPLPYTTTQQGTASAAARL